MGEDRSSGLALSGRDHSLLAGERGEGAALAMRILVEAAEMMGASELVDISSAHIDGCLYHGNAGIDFVDTLVSGGARVTVRSTLNVGSLDLLHPEIVGLGPAKREASKRLMDGYLALGCEPTWTCAPYQLAERPSRGEQVAWAESNAVVFANSVLGARTERYGDFLDICAAITGRAPAVGLHLDEPRAPTLRLDVSGLGDLVHEDVVYPLIGYVLGREAGRQVAVITGIPGPVEEDRLKALGAAAASSGSVALFHVAGVTPEAPDPADPVLDRLPTLTVDEAVLRQAHRSLSSPGGGVIDAVSLGTPHYSADEIRQLVALLAGRSCRARTYVSTGRDLVAAMSHEISLLEQSGVQVVTDTCTYVTPIIEDARVVMTDSAKWAYYAPSNLGVEVVFGSTPACVEAAVTGQMGRPW